MMLFQNLFDLSRRQSIQTAPERAELNQRKIWMLHGKLRSMIQARMIAPLIDYRQSATVNRKMIDRVF